MTVIVVRAVLAVFWLVWGIRLLLEPAQHASVVTCGVLMVFAAGASTALAVCEFAEKRRKRTKL